MLLGAGRPMIHATRLHISAHHIHFP